ncbi:MAG: hypothetical protein Q4A31_07875 [Corynebacterium sp.]|uniref:divisome protein SepX/GlpR n=1 Tax=Corynebacterium sp. TaxID=1720 RepID=UPI0026DCEE2A|nr:gephyrin-like molybdotransferase receptor GlpR [Corynebacterium sp.]MDO4761819.1 hypothetical protein [Corynebacterium sp.]
MTGLIGLIIIVVLWIFVLAPWILRAQKPIRKAGEALTETRVIHSGGSAPVRRRRRLKLSPAQATATGELPAEGDSLVDEDSSLHYGDDCDEKFDQEDLDDTLIVEADVADESDSEDLDDETHYRLDTSYIDPEDLLYPDTAVADADEGEDDVDTLDNTSEELTEEELAYIAHRRGRGGYDPDADRARALSRQKRRQRTLLGLACALILALGVSTMLGGVYWAVTGVVVALSATYLYALRTQVKAENALRHRRIQQLRRTRLGVRTINDSQLGIPSRLRRPGAIVLEIDDESPDFTVLDTVDINDYLNPTGHNHTEMATRRVS